MTTTTETHDGRTVTTTTEGERAAFAFELNGSTFHARYLPAYRTETVYAEGSSLAGSSWASTGPAVLSVTLSRPDGLGVLAVHGDKADELLSDRDALVTHVADVLAERAANRALAAELAPLSAYLPRGQEPDLPKAGVDELSVGDVVWVYSRGNVRRGRVEKLGRSKVHVVYVSSTGTITRKTDSHVWVEG